MNFTRVKITTTVPLENASAVRGVLGKAGAANKLETLEEDL
jgi:hypothetical protein